MTRTDHASRGFAVLASALLLALVLGPLPLASVPPAPRALLTGGLALLGAVALLGFAWRGGALRWPAGGTPLLLFTGYCCATLWLPPLPLDADTQALLGGHVPDAATLVPSRTASRVRELAAVAVVLGLAGGLLHTYLRASKLCATLVALGACLSVYGILLHGGAVPPLTLDQPREVVCATYFNRNHFAGLLEMALLAGIGLLLARHAARSEVDPHYLPLQVVLLGALLLCGTALLMTQSRGGITAACAGAAGLAVLIARHHATRDQARRSARRWWLLALPAALALALVAAPASLWDRFAQAAGDLDTTGRRPDIWSSGIELARAFPITGTGLGTYVDVSPLTQAPGIGGRLEHAHSDPLEIWIETGVVGVGLLLLAATSFWLFVWRRLPLVRDPARAYLGIGLAAGVLAITVHGAVDFNLQIPANALWCAALAGAACAVLQRRRPTAPRPILRWLAVPAAAALLLTAALSVAEGSAAVVRSDARYALANRLHQGAGEGWVAAGQELLAQAPADADAARAAEHLAARGLARNPLSPRAHRLLGRARLRRDAHAADASFAQSLRFTNPYDRPYHQLDIARDHLAAGELEHGLRWLRELLQARPDMATDVLDELYRSIPVYEVVRMAVPEDAPAARRSLAQILGQHGDHYGRELELAGIDGREPRPGTFTLQDGVTLLRSEVAPRQDRIGTRVTVRLWFELEAQPAAPTAETAPRRVRVRFDGPGAAGVTDLEVREGLVSWELVMDHSYPPGSYPVVLQWDPQLAPLPLGTLSVDEHELDLMANTRTPAGELYWHAAQPLARHHPATGVPLRKADWLARGVRTGHAGTLVLVTDTPALLQVSLDGEPLPRLGAGATKHTRCPLPAGASGWLEVRAAHDDAPLVRELLFLPEAR